MTDRIRTLTVLLEKDVRIDDAERYVEAIRMLSGVRKVILGEPMDIDKWMAIETARADLRVALGEVLYPKRKTDAQ